MKNSTIVGISAILVSLSLVALVFILANKVRLLEFEIEVKDSEISKCGILAYKSDYLTGNLNANIQYDGFTISGDEFTDLNGSINDFGYILKKSPTLVYRYCELNCKDCILFGMLELKGSTTENIIVLSYYSDLHSFKTESKLLNENNFPMYNISYITDLDDLSTPYYFILHENKTISDVFIPNKMFPEVTKHYIEMIKKKYFK